MRKLNPVLWDTSVRIEKIGKKHHSRLWVTVARLLRKPRSLRPEVNVGRISKHTKPGDVVVVPGKVLGHGTLKHGVTVAALSFSESARRKIEEAGGKVLTLEELAIQNPKGSGIKLMV